ncbi:MAG: fumarylacetoacetate hydrolase family protein [Candidatus Bathyarchaeota archaeon]|nr:fumarylacetoacetate hydrolase family protein [Candidatus Bathyarchaeota archaeon]
MKLVTFKVHTESRVGALMGDKVVDLNSAYALIHKEKGKGVAKRHADALIPGCMIGFLEGGEESMKAAREALAYAEKHPDAVGLDEEKLVMCKSTAKLQAPVPRPGKLYCVAVNFYDHATERIKDPEARQKEIDRLKSLKLDVPDVFQKPPSLVVGPRDPLIKVKATEKMDYECELAVVIGKKGNYIPAEKAYEYIAGYTVFIDVSARDQGFPQDVDFRMFKHDVNWTKGKGMDNAGPMGPCIVTSDEIPDPYNPPLRLKTRVNGKERQNNTVEHMIIRIPRIIEYMSNGTTLMPGDVIATGTVAGVAHSWGPEGFLKVGDIVECEIEPMGTLKHKVIGE